MSLRGRRSIRLLAALAAALAAAVGVAACGSALSGNAVAEVAGTPVTKATFGHWMRVLAASATGKPDVPSPPSYKACIARLKASQPKPAKGKKPASGKQLKAQCEQEYTALKGRALSFLINSNWLLGEAEDKKVEVGNREVEKQLSTEKNAHFHTEAEFKGYLAKTDQTVSDLLLRVKDEMIIAKLRERIAKQASNKPVSKGEVKNYYQAHKSQYAKQPLSKVEATIKQTVGAEREQQALLDFGKSYKKKWTALTECRPEYRVEGCSGYKPPKTPSLPSTTTTVPPASSSSSSRSSSTTRSSSTSSSSTASGHGKG